MPADETHAEVCFKSVPTVDQPLLLVFNLLRGTMPELFEVKQLHHFMRPTLDGRAHSTNNQ